MQLKILSLLVILTASPLLGKAQQPSIHSFTLKECIQYGLQNHPSVRVYQNNVENARQQKREYLASYLPQVNVAAGLDDNLKLQQTIIPAGTFGPGTEERRIAFGTQYNSSMSVQLDQKIYDQSMLVGLKGSKLNVGLASEQQEGNKEDLIYNIAYAYYQILVAQKQLGLLESNKSRFQQILKITKLQANQGVAKQIDVKQVQVNLNNVLSQISTTENNLNIAENTLKNNIGLSPTDSIVLKDTAKWLNQTPSIQPYSGFDYDQTTASQIQKIQIQLYNFQKQSIKFQTIPTLSFYARYGSNGFGQELSGAYNPLLDYSAIGLRLSWAIFTGFRRDAQYKEATINIENAMENYNLNKSLQNLQYQNAKARSNEARSTILTNKENMNLASEVYDNTTLQYRQGVASLSDLLNAELSYREAQNNYINSLLNYYIANLAVKKANGQLEKYLEQL